MLTESDCLNMESIGNCVPGDGEETGKAAEAADETNKRLSSEANYEGIYHVMF